MQPFLSVSPVYDSLCMTWTVYWTLNLRRLPTLILSALFTVYPECLPPAPILSLNSDSDSALPTLCLKLVLELCLSDLHSILIKLHMDPHAPDSVLQITCLCFVNTLAMPGGTITQQRCTRRSVIIRRPIVISKPQIFPFRVRLGV